MTVSRHLLASVLATAAATSTIGMAEAQSSLSVPLALGPDGSVQAVQYSCSDGTEIAVQYVNAGSNSLALIPLAGETIVYVNVVAGSGARYVSGASEWWTKGDEARLSSELGDAEAVDCSAASGGKKSD